MLNQQFARVQFLGLGVYRGLYDIRRSFWGVLTYYKGILYYLGGLYQGVPYDRKPEQSSGSQPLGTPVTILQ